MGTLAAICSTNAAQRDADERVQCNAAVQVVVKLKTPKHDVTTHWVTSVLEFTQLAIEWPVCGVQIHWL